MLKKQLLCLFIQSIFSLCLYADSFMGEESKQSYEKSKENPDILVFVTSHVIPLNSSFVQNTPYGKMIVIPQEALNPQSKAQIVSKGMYNHGNYTIFRSDNKGITFYRHTKNKTHQYNRMAPNIYQVKHFAGTFYKVEPMPRNISECSLIISRTFETQKTTSPQLFLNLDSVPNLGVANLMLECPKPSDY